jgi:hypothetical protein
MGGWRILSGEHANMMTPAFIDSDASTSPNETQLTQARLKRLFDDLAFALKRTQTSTLRAWGLRSAGRFVKLTGQRVSVLAALAARIGRASSAEFTGLLQAWRADRLGEQVGDRTAAGIDGSIALARGAHDLVTGVGGALMDNPRENAPKVLAAFLGFYAGSGGVDGDGGIPDLDLLAGIDAHRSLLTHSIVAGVAAEGVLLAIADLASEVHEKLPFDHDPLWDRLAEAGAPLTASLAAGASAGIAYHLLWDAGIEPAPYKDLPFSMPIETHVGLMGANGAAEAAYAASRFGNDAPATYNQGPPSVSSTGRNFVEKFSRSVDAAGQLGKDFLGRFHK